jgi:uncharacterized glyoxalase superfamily protein PhnB
MHAEVRIGDSPIMFADDFTAEFGMEPLAKGRMPFHIHMYVPDVDAAWKQAVDAGCEIKMPLTDQFWGDRYGHLRDPFGVMWSLATHTEDLTPEEISERMAKAFAAGHP